MLQSSPPNRMIFSYLVYDFHSLDNSPLSFYKQARKLLRYTAFFFCDCPNNYLETLQTRTFILLRIVLFAMNRILYFVISQPPQIY